MIKTRYAYCLLVLSALVASLQAATEAAALLPAYTVTNLGHLGGESTVGLDINNRGQVVGESILDGGIIRAFLYSDDAIYDLGTLGGDGSRAHAINSSGQVAGWSYTADGPDPHAFLWTPTTPNGQVGAMLDLGTLGGSTSRAFGLNDAGHVVGESYTANGEVHGFLYDGAMHDLGISLGGYAYAVAINNSGQIAGASIAFDGLFHATLYDDGTLYDLGNFGGPQSFATSINDRGQVVGTWDWETPDRVLANPFIYENGTSHVIGALGAYPNDINNTGVIVGTASPAEVPRHPFIYTRDSGVLDLNDLIDPRHLDRGPNGVADELIWANAINDRGQIVATGWNSYLLTPVPEPTSTLLLVLSLPLFTIRVRNSKRGENS